MARGLLKRVGLALALGILALLVSIPEEVHLPIPSYGVGAIVSFVTLVGYSVADDIYHRLTGKEPESVVLLKHYEELKTDVFAKLRDSKAVLTNGTHSDKGHYYSSTVSLFLTIDQDSQIDPIPRFMAFDHLRNRRYDEQMERYRKTKAKMEDYNAKVEQLIGEVENEANLAFLRYPMLSNSQSQEDNTYYLERIIQAIASAKSPSEIVAHGNEIFGPVSLTRIGNELVRQFFMGEIRMLVSKYSKRFLELHIEGLKIGLEYNNTFPTFMLRLINTIDDKHELEGSCDFEKGKMQPYA